MSRLRIDRAHIVMEDRHIRFLVSDLAAAAAAGVRDIEETLFLHQSVSVHVASHTRHFRPRRERNTVSSPTIRTEHVGWLK
jgi:hypothetical protein